MSQEVEQSLDAAERAQDLWAQLVVRRRLKAIGQVAREIAKDPGRLVDAIHRPNADRAAILASEVLPLADACRFVAKRGRQILAPVTHSSWTGSWWMGRVGVRTLREPWGNVLILGPSNYPLFLPGVQVIQALAAGNAVLLKPAPSGADVAREFQQLLHEAGIPEGLVQILPTTIEAGQDAIHQGVDKVVLTGSVHTGRAVMRAVAETLTPATMELSGCDSAFITPQADLARAAKAIAFALRLNGGATCIAPRRIFVTREQSAQFAESLKAELSQLAQKYGETFEVAAAASAATIRSVEQALATGASLLYGELPGEAKSSQMQPIVLTDVTPKMEVARADLFAPISSVLVVEDMSEAVNADRLCPYSLGASVFGPKTHADHWAREIDAGCVVINDVIVPTADPRVPFGGRAQSGWGVTRGAEGLLEMTQPKTICVRKGNWLPHLDPEQAGNAPMLEQLLKFFHSESLKGKFTALRQIIRLGRPEAKHDDTKNAE